MPHSSHGLQANMLEILMAFPSQRLSHMTLMWHKCVLVFFQICDNMLLFGCGLFVYDCVFSRRQVEWEAASSLIEGICLTLQRQPIISFLPHLRSLINVCVNLVWEKTRWHKPFYYRCCPLCILSIYFCVLPGYGCGWTLQCSRWASTAPPQPLSFSSTALQHSSGPTGCPTNPGKLQLNLFYSSNKTLPKILNFASSVFLIIGLEGWLSTQSCHLAFHQSREARRDAA